MENASFYEITKENDCWFSWVRTAFPCYNQIWFAFLVSARYANFFTKKVTRDMTRLLSSPCDACGKPVGGGFKHCPKCNIYLCFMCRLTLTRELQTSFRLSARCVVENSNLNSDYWVEVDSFNHLLDRTLASSSNFSACSTEMFVYAGCFR